MTHVECSAVAPAPPATVFAVLADVGSADSWLGGVSASRKVTNGPTGVGTDFEQTRVTMGRASKVEGQITRHEPGRALGFDIKRDGKPAGVVLWTLAPEGAGGTRVTCAIDFQLPGLMKLFTPMVKRTVQKQTENDLQALAERARKLGPA